LVSYPEPNPLKILGQKEILMRRASIGKEAFSFLRSISRLKIPKTPSGILKRMLTGTRPQGNPLYLN
jgi:hypothetical protein